MVALRFVVTLVHEHSRDDAANASHVTSATSHLRKTHIAPDIASSRTWIAELLHVF